MPLFLAEAIELHHLCADPDSISVRRRVLFNRPGRGRELSVRFGDALVADFLRLGDEIRHRRRKMLARDVVGGAMR